MTISVPNKFAGTATSDVSALDANFAALVNFLNSLGLPYAALAGLATQTFDVADATSNSEAVNFGQAQANFALLAGFSGQTFDVAAAVAATEAVPLAQAVANFAALGGSITQNFAAAAFNCGGGLNFDNSVNPGFIECVNFDNFSLISSAGQIAVGVNAANQFTLGGVAVQALFAALAGSSTQTFDVAAAVAATEAVPLAQAQALYFSTTTNVTASRVLGTTYTNTDSTARFVTFSVWANGTTGIEFSATVGPLTVYSSLIPAGLRSTSFSFVVPPGSTYRIIQSVTGAYSNLVWTETR